MRALALVTARELRAYAPAWAAALVAATLPWLAPLLPVGGGQPAADVRLATAAAIAALLGLTFALFAGAGLLARDLAEGRMGFFLALPLAAGTVWAGRLLAAAILVYGTMAAIVVPAALAAGELWRPAAAGLLERPLFDSLAGAGAVVLLPPLFLLLLAHLLATAVRSRSPWLLADLGGLTVAAVVVTRSLARLLQGGAPLELLIGAAVVAAIALIVLLPSGGIGLARGGVLLTRVHRAQAAFVAGGLLVAALATAGFTRWVLAVDAGDLTAVEEVEAAPAGSWLVTRGPLRHRPSYRPWILVDAADGRSLPLAAGRGGRDVGRPSPLAFSADGRRAVWLRPRGAPYGGPSEAVWVELGDHPRVGAGGVDVANVWNTALLVDGDRVAIAEPQRLSVWTDEGRRLLAAAELPRPRLLWQVLRSLPGGNVRLARLASPGDEEPRLQIWDLDVAGRRLVARADRPLDKTEVGAGAALSADGTRLLLAVGWGGRGGAELVDATDGRSLAAFVPAGEKAYSSASFLSGGRVAVAVGRVETLTLRLFDRDGKPLRELPLGRGRWAWLGAPWSADVLPFTANVRDGAGWKGELRVVDLASGAVRSLGGRVTPLVGAAPWWPGADHVIPDAPANRLFRTDDGVVVRVDDAGRQTPVLPRAGGAPAGR